VQWSRVPRKETEGWFVRRGEVSQSRESRVALRRVMRVLDVDGSRWKSGGWLLEGEESSPSISCTDRRRLGDSGIGRPFSSRSGQGEPLV